MQPMFCLVLMFMCMYALHLHLAFSPKEFRATFIKFLTVFCLTVIRDGNRMQYEMLFIFRAFSLPPECFNVDLKYRAY